MLEPVHMVCHVYQLTLVILVYHIKFRWIKNHVHVSKAISHISQKTTAIYGGFRGYPWPLMDPMDPGFRGSGHWFGRISATTAGGSQLSFRGAADGPKPGQVDGPGWVTGWQFLAKDSMLDFFWGYPKET